MLILQDSSTHLQRQQSRSGDGSISDNCEAQFVGKVAQTAAHQHTSIGVHGAVQKYSSAPGFPETAAYVDELLPCTSTAAQVNALG